MSIEFVDKFQTHKSFVYTSTIPVYKISAQLNSSVNDFWRSWSING